MFVTLALKTLVQRLQPLEGLRTLAAPRKDDRIVGIPLRLVELPIGTNPHPMGAADLHAIVDGRGHNLNATPAEHVNNGDGLDLLEAVSQWNKHFSHNELPVVSY